MTEWISVKDRLPEKSGYYLVSIYNKVYRSFFNKANGWETIGNVTHWMPLPEPPEGSDSMCTKYINPQGAKICLTEDCPYQKGQPCEAAEGCGGYEGE